MQGSDFATLALESSGRGMNGMSEYDSLLSKIETREAVVGIVGLGYVGLPLAVEFGRKYPTVGFDINADRVAELESGVLAIARFASWRASRAATAS